MTLSRKIAAAVEAVPETATVPVLITAEAGPARLALSLIAAGPVGLAFNHLDFTVAGRPDLADTGLRDWADRLAARLTYLMEPLVVIELDPIIGQAELRSQVPTPRPGVRSYYEVRLGRAHTLHLARIAFDEATRRRKPVPCQFTTEVLERLADDLVELAA